MRIEPTKATYLSRPDVGARPGVPLELSTLERPCVACCMYFYDQRFQLSTLTVAGRWVRPATMWTDGRVR
jgi:hypothetical protein